MKFILIFCGTLFILFNFAECRRWWNKNDESYFNYGVDDNDDNSSENEDYFRYYHRNSNNENTRNSNNNNNNNNNCSNCAKVEDCKIVIDLAIKLRIPVQELIIKNKEKIVSCGSSYYEPLICCSEDLNSILTDTRILPTTSGYEVISRRRELNLHRSSSSITTTTEEPWIWDIEYVSKESIKPVMVPTTTLKYFNRNEGPIYTPTERESVVPDSDEEPDYSVGPRFNFYPNNKNYRWNLVDFEDPRTKKNCPPIFFNFDYSNEYHHRDYYDYNVKNNQPRSSGNRNNRNKPNWNRRKNPYFYPLESTPSPYVPFPTRKTQNRRKLLPPTNRQNGILLNSPVCGISVSTRILGGTDAGPGEFPWMARIVYRNRTSGRLSYRCAGSLISEKFVITAAHCVTNLISSLDVCLVRLGELNSKRTTNCYVDPVNCFVPQDYEIEQLIPHPNYDTPKYANDIALIKLRGSDSSIPLTPICLPMGEFSRADEELTGKLGVVAGWASNAAGITSPSSSLQYVKLPISNRTECAVTYAQFSANSRTPIIISEAQICAQGRQNLDACQGDSGGPLMNEGTDENPRYILLGLVSFGPRTCGISHYPGVYTRVSSYIDWIKAIVYRS